MKTSQIQIGKYQADNNIVESTGNGLKCDCVFDGNCIHINQVLFDLKQIW